MKKGILLLISFIFICSVNFAQNKYKIYTDLGVKYTPLEYLGGVVFGVSVNNQKKNEF